MSGKKNEIIDFCLKIPAKKTRKRFASDEKKVASHASRILFFFLFHNFFSFSFNQIFWVEHSSPSSGPNKKGAGSLVMEEGVVGGEGVVLENEGRCSCKWIQNTIRIRWKRAISSQTVIRSTKMWGIRKIVVGFEVKNFKFEIRCKQISELWELVEGPNYSSLRILNHQNNFEIFKTLNSCCIQDYGKNSEGYYDPENEKYCTSEPSDSWNPPFFHDLTIFFSKSKTKNEKFREEKKRKKGGLFPFKMIWIMSSGRFIGVRQRRKKTRREGCPFHKKITGFTLLKLRDWWLFVVFGWPVFSTENWEIGRCGDHEEEEDWESGVLVKDGLERWDSIETAIKLLFGIFIFRKFFIKTKLVFAFLLWMKEILEQSKIQMWKEEEDVI